MSVYLCIKPASAAQQPGFINLHNNTLWGPAPSGQPPVGFLESLAREFEVNPPPSKCHTTTTYTTIPANTTMNVSVCLSDTRNTIAHIPILYFRVSVCIHKLQLPRKGQSDPPPEGGGGLVYIYIYILSTYKHKVEKIVQLGYNATSAHVICIFLSFHFFFPFFFSSFSKTSEELAISLSGLE